MSAFRKFDPYAVILGSGGAPPKVAKVAKVAKVGKVDPANPKTGATLGALGTLGGFGAEIRNPSDRPLAAIAPAMDADSLGAQSGPSPQAPGIVPVAWVAGLQRLNGMTCPVSVEPNRWLQLQGDANRFVAAWGRQAAALGWSTLDIFGCHPTHPADRYDAMGLVWMIADAEVVTMGAEVVNLRKAAGTSKGFGNVRSPTDAFLHGTSKLDSGQAKYSDLRFTARCGSTSESSKSSDATGIETR
jgi:hypothetical protein